MTEEVKKQAEQRINSRVVMHVLEGHNLALKSIQRVDVMETRHDHKNSRKQEITWETQKTQNYGTVVERHFEDETYQMCMHEQGYTQSDVEEFDRKANEK